MRATFFRKGDRIVGFDLDGHCGGVAGRDIVCAAVSSAAYLTANTLTEVCGLSADVSEADGKLHLRLTDKDISRGDDVMNGFYLHLKGLHDQYPTKIEIIDSNDTEV